MPIPSVSPHALSGDELQHYMELSKLQVPTTHQEDLKKDGEQPGPSTSSTVLEWKEFKPSTAGREKFGEGTRGWPQHDLSEECLKDFSR
jgi:hypothetical protein